MQLGQCIPDGSCHQALVAYQDVAPYDVAEQELQVFRQDSTQACLCYTVAEVPAVASPQEPAQVPAPYVYVCVRA